MRREWRSRSTQKASKLSQIEAKKKKKEQSLALIYVAIKLWKASKAFYFRGWFNEMTSLSYDAALERAPTAWTHRSPRDPLISAHEKCFFWSGSALHPEYSGFIWVSSAGFVRCSWFEGSASKWDNSTRCLRILRTFSCFFNNGSPFPLYQHRVWLWDVMTELSHIKGNVCCEQDFSLRWT